MRVALLCMTLVAALAALAYGQDELSVQAESDEQVYVLKEPIRVSVTLRNASPVVVRVPQISRLDMDEMAFIYYEVSGPDGTERRKSVRHHTYRVYVKEYSGIPLAPGESIQLVGYPILTNQLVDEDGSFLAAVGDVATFPVPGTYELRVVYHSRREFPNVLGAQEQQRWVSNPVMIEIRTPDESEKQILDVLWHCRPLGRVGLVLNGGI